MTELGIKKIEKYDLYNVTVISENNEIIYEKVTEKDLENMMGKCMIRIDKVTPCLRLGEEEISFSDILERTEFITNLSLLFHPLEGDISFSRNQEDSLALDFKEQKVFFSNIDEKNDFLEAFEQGAEVTTKEPQKKLTL